MDIKTKLMLMKEYNLNTEETFVLELLFLASAEENHSEHLYEFYNSKLNILSLREILMNLQDKGIILKSYVIQKENSIFEPRNVAFNKNFLNKYMKFSGELGQELFNVYPHFVTINGITYNIANFAKKFNSEEEFYYSYGKAIGWNYEKHLEIIDLIKWAKDNTNFLNHNICDFVIAKEWNRLDELKNGETNVNIIFDTITCL